MPTFDPEDLIGRTFLLHKRFGIIDQENGYRRENINFILDIGNGKVEELVSNNQLLAQDNDLGMDQ